MGTQNECRDQNRAPGRPHSRHGPRAVTFPLGLIPVRRESVAATPAFIPRSHLGAVAEPGAGDRGVPALRRPKANEIKGAIVSIPPTAPHRRGDGRSPGHHHFQPRAARAGF